MAMIQKLIFPTEIATSNITAEFEIENAIGILRFDGLADTDRVLIESYFGTECEGWWIPTVFCCKQMSTSGCSTHMIIPIPGRYRAVLVSEDDTHLTDPTYFEGVKMTFEKHNVTHDISSYFQLCC